MNRATAALLIGMLAPHWSACSDTTTTVDSTVDGLVIPDTTVDTGVTDGPAETSTDLTADSQSVDQTVDAPSDLAVDATPETATDGGPDAVIPDTQSDGIPPDGGLPTIWGYVSRSVTPLLDGKGDLYIGLYQPLLPIPLASSAVNGVDMSQNSASIKYQLFNPPPGVYSLVAFLDDNRSATLFPAPMADAGDLVLSVFPEVTVGAVGGQRIDLVLDKIQGGGQGLKGTVRASVNPSGDGVGNLYISLHLTPPPSPSLAGVMMKNVDLSSQFSTVTYIINAQPGNYYLNIFLDDNNSVNMFVPGADKGDLIHKSSIQVHIVQGQLNLRDVVLDQVKP